MQRATGTTKMNELSSRSHAVFIIIIEKSTVTSTHEADGDEMEQFRGLAPGAACSGLPCQHRRSGVRILLCHQTWMVDGGC